MPIITEKRRITPRDQAKTDATKVERPKTREEMMIDSLSPNMNIMVKAVRKVGRRMLRDFGEVSQLQVSRKGPGNFVSNADTLAEKTLMEELVADRPDYAFITEESGVFPAQNGCPFTWVIDPIDGTSNFIHAIGVFSISLALMENDEVIAGVLYNPVSNELYYAEKGRGAYLMAPTGTMRCRVSGRNVLDESLIGSNGFGYAPNRDLIAKIIPYVASVRYNGSTTMALACVASGQYDAYVSNRFKIWDIAAAYLLIKEAGGHISTFSGDLDLKTIVAKQELLASNIALCHTYIKLLK